MTFFDQRGQHVNTQYNAKHMNFGSVDNTVDLVAELQNLNEEIARAKGNGVISKKHANEVEYHVKQVVDEAEEPEPDKNLMVNHLNTAKVLIGNIAAASGLVTTLVGAIEAVQKLFS